MRPVWCEDRASLRPRTADALPLLRRTVLCGIPKDDGAGSREETAMKCSNPNCGHGIGLVSYQRHWFDKRRFCSKKCRYDFTVERRASRNASSAATSIGYSQTPRRKLLRATIHGNWRKRALQRIGGRPRSSARIRVESPMSALGQKRTYAVQKVMSALPPESDIKCDRWGCPLRAKSGHRTYHSIS